MMMLPVLGLGAALGLATAPDAGAQDEPADTVGVADELIFKLRHAGPRRLGRDAPITLRRLSDGDAARGQVVSGRPLEDEAGRRVAVVPWLIQDHYRRQGLSVDESRLAMDDLLRRVERRGKLGRLEDVDREVRAHYGAASGYSVFLGGEATSAFPGTDDVGTAALRDLRAWLCGDDALWAEHVAGSSAAYDELAAGAGGLRFRQAAGPDRTLESLRHRQVLYVRSRRFVTFEPTLPLTADLTGAGLQTDSYYELRVTRKLPAPVGKLLTGRGGTIALRGRTTRVRTSESDPFLQEGDAAFAPAALRVVAVTPPDGERNVDPGATWDEPRDIAELDPRHDHFHASVLFSEPIDPRSLGVGVGLFQVAAHVGTPDERAIDVRVPGVDVRLAQHLRGDVTVELDAKRALDPAATYEIRVDGGLRALRSGLRLGADRRYVFHTVASLRGDEIVSDSEFLFDWRPGIVQEELPYTAIAPSPPELDPERIGLLLANPDLSTSVAHSGWFDTTRIAPLLYAPMDDPDTPEVEGTRILLPDDGSTVAIDVRAAPGDVADRRKANLFLATPWVPLEDIGTIGNRQFVQWRVTFTLPEGRAPGDPLPAVDRLMIGVRGD